MYLSIYFAIYFFVLSTTRTYISDSQYGTLDSQYGTLIHNMVPWNLCLIKYELDINVYHFNSWLFSIAVSLQNGAVHISTVGDAWQLSK